MSIAMPPALRTGATAHSKPSGAKNPRFGVGCRYRLGVFSTVPPVSGSGQRKSRLSLGSRAILCENQDLDAEGIGSRGDQSLSFPPIVMVAPILSQGVPLSISRLQK